MVLERRGRLGLGFEFVDLARNCKQYWVCCRLVTVTTLASNCLEAWGRHEICTFVESGYGRRVATDAAECGGIEVVLPMVVVLCL